MGIVYDIFETCCKKKSKKKQFNVFGLKNLGNTCFMNSSLQCIFNSNKLIENIEKINTENSNKLRLIKEISLLQKEQEKGETILDPKKIKDILGETIEKYRYNEQNDANEFIILFLNHLLKELYEIGKYEPGKIPINEIELEAFNKLEKKFFLKNKCFLLNLFYGRLKKEYYCENGHLCLIKFNNFSSITLPPYEDKNELVDLLKVYQGNKKINDTIFCDICKAKKYYSIKTIIYNIPEYFIISLEKEKLYSSNGIKYPQILETKDFMDTKNNEKYSLISLIVYFGDKKSGHYTSKCKKNNNWYHISDTIFRSIDQNEINDKNTKILFYEKISEK